ncbi:5860_t:CDS:2 [Scutellospora calospora]|uniref:5860_t:CDS:1 n=1 Tax=Scutellospora calospora TaxID=85575 RepID=A0ACA9LNM8_9GLOM|nr:5860_t:CDS:2 [Scutellospora calospora]
MLPKYENTSNSQDANFIYDYDTNFINVESASIGETESFYRATFKEYDIPTILKSITIPQQSSLNEFIRELNRHQNTNYHNNILRIFGLTMPVAIIYGKRETEIIGTPRKYSIVYEDCWNHDATKRPDIQQVVLRLNELICLEEFEKDITMEEDEIPQNQVDQRYKIEDQHLLLQELLQFFITQFNTTTNSVQIINNLNNYFEVNQINPSLIFNSLAYQDYNFSMIGYFHEHGIGTEVDYHKAFWMYKLSSENNLVASGNSDAQIEVAKCYMNGIGTNIDRAKAFDLYSNAATSGNSEAQFELANCYINGICTNVDNNRAFELYLKSAKNGNTNAMYELASCYSNGTGTIKNRTKAFEWYIKSAELNNPVAFYTVGFCYEYGLGTVVDKMKAYEWYFKSTKQGDDCIAQYKLGLLSKRLSTFIDLS